MGHCSPPHIVQSFIVTAHHWNFYFYFGPLEKPWGSHLHLLYFGVVYTLSEAWSGVSWADLMAAQGAFGTNFYDRSILRPKHPVYYRSGRPVIKIGPKGALGSREIPPIHSAPSLGQSIPVVLPTPSVGNKCGSPVYRGSRTTWNIVNVWVNALLCTGHGLDWTNQRMHTYLESALH